MVPGALSRVASKEQEKDTYSEKFLRRKFRRDAEKIRRRLAVDIRASGHGPRVLSEVSRCSSESAFECGLFPVFFLLRRFAARTLRRWW